MNKRMKIGTAAALLSLLLTGPLPMGAFAQQPSGTGGPPDASKGNTMTGGAEAQPTDKGTPSPGQDAAGASGTGGTSDASKGNTMTGGAEAQPTDKGTPGAGAGGAASPDGGAGTASGSGQGKP